MRPNGSGSRGTRHQPTSRALGLCLMGGKKGPTVNGNPDCSVHVGSVVIGLGRGRGLARLGQLRLQRGPRGGAVRGVGAGERPVHGDAPQSLPDVPKGSREDEDVCPTVSKPHGALPPRRCTTRRLASTIATGASVSRHGERPRCKACSRTTGHARQASMAARRMLCHPRVPSAPASRRSSKSSAPGALARRRCDASTSRRSRGHIDRWGCPPAQTASDRCGSKGCENQSGRATVSTAPLAVDVDAARWMGWRCWRAPSMSGARTSGGLRAIAAQRSLVSTTRPDSPCWHTGELTVDSWP